MRLLTTEHSLLPTPKGAFFAVVNHVTLGVLVGEVEVAIFDQVINAVIAATAGTLQADLAQFKLMVKRILVHAG